MEIKDMSLVGSGAQADVYLYKGRAIKVYKTGYKQADAQYEADMQEMARQKGLPVPEIYEVVEIEGKVAIVMEYVDGTAIGENMLRDIEKAGDYLNIVVDLQIAVHQISGDGFPSQKEKMRNNIMETVHLEEGKRQGLLQLLQGLKSGDRFCHGDFHVMNLLQVSQDIKIIDWIDASKGNIAADVCRSYLLYLLYRDDIAEMYLDAYCNKSNMRKQAVLEWLPVIAGARLNENVANQDKDVLLRFVNGGV